MRVNTIICDDLYTYEMLKDMNSEFIDALYLNEDEEECEEPEEEYDDTQVIGGEQLSMLNDMGFFVVAGRYDEAGTALCDGDKKCKEQVEHEQADMDDDKDDDLDGMLESMLDEELGEEPEFDAASKKSASPKASVAALPDKKKKAPVILSIRDYIVSHYSDQMCLELGACLLAGMLKTYGCSVTEVYDDTFKIGKMSFWRETSRTCFAYVQLTIDAIEQRRGSERIGRRNYSAIISFDMTEEKVKTEITYGLYDPDDEKEWAKTLYKLDDYLVPIMTKQQIEEAAWKLHRDIFPTAETSYEGIRREYDACNLARRMGLEVMTLPLHKKKKTKSMLFFCADKVLVDVHHPDGTTGKKWVKVPADCIVINLNAVPKDNYQLEVFHECIHYDFHYEKDADLKKLKDTVRDHLTHVLLPEKLLRPSTRILINPSGRFVKGGPSADTGLTGRKLAVDMYGPVAHIGGGALSGKDPTKTDRSGAYAARWVAKNIVASGLASKCEVQIAYAIGRSKPVSVDIDTFGTGILSNAVIKKAVNETFDLRPAAVIDALNLRAPFYALTSVYGHFGHNDMSWEDTSKRRELLSTAIRLNAAEKESEKNAAADTAQ